MDDDRNRSVDPVRPGSPVAGSVLLLGEPFTASTITTLRHRLTAAVTAAGLAGAASEDFVLAAHELMTNAVRHGGGAGHLELRQTDDILTCEVVDHGRPDDLPVRLSPTDQAGGRGLWLAHQLTSSLILSRRPDGVTASISVCVTEAPTVQARP
ncbi:ATP-binding protein [Actinoplanes sp. NPDC049265]|uniref:ATP-binding protein n=1 Tax=Actinoplanes sp. NPDC049265 TaxID=3363902 RepID=UPI0037145F93